MNNSLAGLRVLNTRPAAQAKKLSNSIREAGGIAIECPTIEIKPVQEWLSSLPDLTQINQALFISVNAVVHCFNQLNQNNITWPDQIEVIAIGEGTKNVLEKFNIKVHDQPSVSDSEHLIRLPSLQQIKNQSLILFKGEGGRPLIEQVLLLRGATLHILSVYERVMTTLPQAFLKSLWRDDQVDIILLTSEQSIQFLFKMLGKEAYHWLQTKPCLVISPRLAQFAASLGIEEVIISHPDKILDALFEYKGSKNGQKR